MLHKCANPECDTQFRYLRLGKLFEVETHYRERWSGDKASVPGNGKGHVERFWLCDQCASSFVLRFERKRGLVLESRPGDREKVETEVIAQSHGKGASEIARLRVRPLDLNFPVVHSERAGYASEVRG